MGHPRYDDAGQLVRPVLSHSLDAHGNLLPVGEDIAADAFANVTATGTLLAGQGVLTSIVVSDPGDSVTATVYDGTSASGTVKIATIPLVADMELHFGRGILLGAGLHIVLSGAADLTVCFRAEPWSPANIPRSLQLGWIDFERLGLVTVTGGAVAEIADSWSGAIYAQATAGSRPVYDAAAFNGRPAAVFDGVDDFLRNTESLFPTSGAYEIWALVNYTGAATDGNRIIFGWPNSASNGTALSRLNVSGASRGRLNVGAGSSVTPTEGTVHCIGRRVLRGRADGVKTWVEVDGVRSAELAAVPAFSGSPRNTIGASAASTPANFWLGGINTILVTRLLTDAMAARLYRWLNARKG